MSAPQENSNGTATNRLLVGIIVALISSHYVSVIIRLDKVEAALVEMRKEAATAALNTAVTAANALSAAVQVLEKKAGQ